MEVLLTGELQPYAGCAIGKGQRKVIPPTTTTRATKELERAFTDLSGERDVALVGVSHHYAITRDEITQYT